MYRLYCRCTVSSEIWDIVGDIFTDRIKTISETAFWKILTLPHSAAPAYNNFLSFVQSTRIYRLNRKDGEPKSRIAKRLGMGWPHLIDDAIG